MQLYGDNQHSCRIIVIENGFILTSFYTASSSICAKFYARAYKVTLRLIAITPTKAGKLPQKERWMCPESNSCKGI
jgi:hypothetical protein